jgi:hypothetical protein
MIGFPDGLAEKAKNATKNQKNSNELMNEGTPPREDRRRPHVHKCNSRFPRRPGSKR